MNKIIRKVGLAVVKNRRVLMVRSKNQKVFYTLGGKVEESETDVTCLQREIQEEVGSKLDNSTIKFLSEFQDKAHGKKNTLVNIRLYLGKLLDQPHPANEIVELQYFNSQVNSALLSPIGIKIFKWLKDNDYID